MTPSMPAKPSTQMEILLGKMHKVQEMIDEFFTRFDVMNTDIKTVSDEVHILHKQVLDFGEDMDNIKCCIHINDKPVSSSAAGLRCDPPPQADKGTAAPLLQTLSWQQQAGNHTVSSSSYEQEEECPTCHT